MVMSLRPHFATEKKSVEWCIGQYTARIQHIQKVVARIKSHFDLPDKARILEIGAAQGLSVVVFRQLGYDCTGLEPCCEAIAASKSLFAGFGTDVELTQGYAEDLPFDDGSFDAVIADSVIEHVMDSEKVFSEVYRVLKPYGAFYFLTASSMCPAQTEIRYLPFFGWYPQRLKVSIMDWAVKNRPSLVGYTEAPARNWFTPWKATRMLKYAGFSAIYGTWELVREEEFGSRGYKILRLIRSSAITRFIADVFAPACMCLSVKNQNGQHAEKWLSDIDPDGHPNS